MNYRTIGYLFSFVGIIIVDRITKYMALLCFTTPQHVYRWLTFELVYNRGISWGMFHDYSAYAASVITLVVALVLAALAGHIVYRYLAGKGVLAELMVLAGACSNFWDRMMYPGVIDFIHLHIGSWHWAIFNIADCAITLGVLAMLAKQYYEGRSA
jgi:signal peptidase II